MVPGGMLLSQSGMTGFFMIDDQFALLSEKNRSAVNVIIQQPVGYVLNTHRYGDHTGGAGAGKG